MHIREFQLERYFARWEFTAPYLLSASDCETMSIGDLLVLTETPLAALTNLRLGYTESQGDPGLRAVVADNYPGLTPDNVVITNAPEEAIFLTMMTLLEPGDRVVVQAPCYQSLFELARYRGCEVEAWPLVETDQSWNISLDRLAELLTRSTKLLVINAPHNPTGYLPSPDEFELILDLAAERDVWLFCDEMYHGLEYDPNRRLPSASVRYDKAVSLWGMSKTFGLPGLRIGWLTLRNEQLIRDLLRFKDYTTICSSAPGELLARLALEHAETLIERSLGIIRQNLGRVRPFMAEFADIFAWREPLAGPIAFARLHQGKAKVFCDDVVHNCGVLLAPSTVFDFGDSHVRFGLGRQSFPEGLSALERYLKEKKL